MNFISSLLIYNPAGSWRSRGQPRSSSHKENNVAFLGEYTWAKIDMCFTLFNQPPRHDHCPPRPDKH